MFQKKYRLPATARMSHPVSIFTPFFTLKIAHNGLDVNRYGFIVSKKTDKRAVARNRIKRRIRACVEQMHEELFPGNDILFLIKKEALDQQTQILWQALQEVFIKKGLVR